LAKSNRTVQLSNICGRFLSQTDTSIDATAYMYFGGSCGIDSSRRIAKIDDASTAMSLFAQMVISRTLKFNPNYFRVDCEAL
jgi:hypothetical protein